MQCRRFTRYGRTIGRRNPLVHLLHFCRVYRSIRVIPAMQAGITDRVWDIAELLSHQALLGLLPEFLCRCAEVSELVDRHPNRLECEIFERFGFQFVYKIW